MKSSLKEIQRLKSLRDQLSIPSDPEEHRIYLEEREGLDQIIEKVTKAYLAKAARKQLRKTKQNTHVVNGITYRVVPTFKRSSTPITPSAIGLTTEVRELAERILQEQNIPGRVIICTRRISFARRQHHKIEVHFGSQSIDRAFSEGFTEYKQLQRMIWPYKVTGISGVRLLVLHEIAHLATFKAYSHRVTPHGSEYQREYSKLLHIYQSELTPRENN